MALYKIHFVFLLTLISNSMFALIVSVVSVLSVVSAASISSASVRFNSTSNSYDIVNKIDDSFDAYGSIYRDVNGSYWNYLDAHMQTEVTSKADHLSYSTAIGFLEGYLTCSEIHTFYPNFYSAVFGTSPPGIQTLAFIKANYEWMVKMAKENAETDEYWYTIQTVLNQINGIYQGYVAGCGGKSLSSYKDGDNRYFMSLEHPTLEHFLLINAWGDLYQIALKFKEPGQNSRKFGNRKLHADKLKLVERCSAIVKILDDKSDIVFGHATWDTYESLGPRIFKHYNTALMRNGFAEHHYDVYFSSSPALISSIDDFFTVSGYAQLGVIETTNSLYNIRLLDLVQPQSVLSWARAVTSNQMAASGADWPVQFSRYHSGTYTNQWMVLDLKLFTPGQMPEEGFFNVLEEVPGLIHTEDMTKKLVADSYWGSYNNPYFEDVSEASGYAKVCSFDVHECHDTCPRANIFREYHSQVQDVDGAKWILSYNSFQNDTYSLNDSCNAIACRGDLEPEESQQGAFGALDAKVSSAVNAKRFPGVAPNLFARLGPTHDQQPVFCWSKVKDESTYVHNGQPDCFDFTWVQLPPLN